MSPFTKHHESTGETPEQTLARLNADRDKALLKAARDEARLDAASLIEPGLIRGRPRGSRFPLVSERFTEGYYINDVDAFIDTLEQRSLGEVRRVRFSTITLIRGYDEQAVDRFLDVQAARLAGEVDPHPAPSRPGPVPRHKELTLEDRQDEWMAGHPRRFAAVMVLSFIIFCLIIYFDVGAF